MVGGAYAELRPGEGPLRTVLILFALLLQPGLEGELQAGAGAGGLHW